MIDIRPLTPADLTTKIDRLWELSADKIDSLAKTYQPGDPSPVFTVAGAYQARGWTEWTQGFQYGALALQFDATRDERFLAAAREAVIKQMAPHVTHVGVHDHGFNNVSTYGNLLRLMNEGVLDENSWERDFYELALKCSGAVQARRWTSIQEGGGYIYSFNGPHSLFADTMRSLRALAVSHQLGHVLMEENDAAISLLDRLVAHAKTTADYTVYYGEGRDAYDVSGRVAHESVFNLNDGRFRCPNSQQGYSPFTTWTRAQAWIMLGYAEELEFIDTLPEGALEAHGGAAAVKACMLKAARATCDYYIDETPTDGIPYWDTGAPDLHKLGDYRDRPAEPFNAHEPVDSSAAAIAGQGLIRLGTYLGDERYVQAGLTTLDHLFSEPYLSLDDAHQGLILHSVYHRPNGWDHVPEGQTVPCGESSMWGDYHAREAALMVQRMARGDTYLQFFS